MIKKGFFNVGFIFLIIIFSFFILFAYQNYYSYFDSKLKYIFQKNTIDVVSLNIGRILAYSKNNLFQDALSDSIAKSTEKSVNNNIINYQVLVATLKTPNNISKVSDINQLIDFSDGDFASCFYKSDYIHYIPKFWTLAYITNDGEVYSYENFLSKTYTKSINGHTYKIFGYFISGDEINKKIPLTPDTYTLYVKHQYIGAEKHTIIINGVRYSDGVGYASNTFTINNTNELDFSPSDIVNKVKKSTSGTVTAYIYKDGQDDVFGDQYVEINITPVSYSISQERTGSQSLYVSSKCGFGKTSGCGGCGTSTYSGCSFVGGDSLNTWFFTPTSITYDVYNTYTEYTGTCTGPGGCCREVCTEEDNGTCVAWECVAYDYTGTTYVASSGTKLVNTLNYNNEFYIFEKTGYNCYSCNIITKQTIKYIRFYNFRLKTTVNGRDVTQELIFDYSTDGTGSGSVTSKTVTFTDFINSTSGSKLITVSFGGDIDITFNVSFKVKSYISGYSLDTYTYNIQNRDFYTVNITFDPYRSGNKFGIKYIELEKQGPSDLFIYNVSKIYCVINPKISEVSKDLINNINYAKLFFAKYVIKNNKINTSDIVSINVQNLKDLLMDLSRDIENPNYQYLTSSLNYAPWSDPEQYGGIVGGKINYKTNYEVEPSSSNFETPFTLKRSKAQVSEVCRTFINNSFEILNETLKEYIINVFNDIISKDSNIRSISLDNIKITSSKIDCDSISTENGFNLSLEICVSYTVFTNDGLSKENEVCEPYNVSFNYKNISFGSINLINPRNAKIANQIFYKWNNKMILPINNNNFEPQYNDVPVDSGKNYICSEDVIGYKVSGDNVIYSTIILNNTRRWYLDPTYIFNHDLNILDTGYKHSFVIGFCDKIYENSQFSNDYNYITSNYNYLINAGYNVISLNNGISILEGNFNNWYSLHRYNDL